MPDINTPVDATEQLGTPLVVLMTCEVSFDVKRI